MQNKSFKDGLSLNNGIQKLFVKGLLKYEKLYRKKCASRICVSV
jgi:hypothetical protein